MTSNVQVCERQRIAVCIVNSIELCFWSYLWTSFHLNGLCLTHRRYQKWLIWQEAGDGSLGSPWNQTHLVEARGNSISIIRFRQKFILKITVECSDIRGWTVPRVCSINTLFYRCWGEDQVRKGGQTYQAAEVTMRSMACFPTQTPWNPWNAQNWQRRYEGYFHVFRKTNGSQIFGIHWTAKVAKN